MFNTMSAVPLLLHFNRLIFFHLKTLLGPFLVVVANRNYANYIRYYNNPRKRKK